MSDQKVGIYLGDEKIADSVPATLEIPEKTEKEKFMAFLENIVVIMNETYTMRPVPYKGGIVDIEVSKRLIKEANEGK
jgi:hypothetical protein